MKTFLGIIAAFALIATVLVGMGTVMFFNYSNEEIVLRNKVSNQQQLNQAVFDEVWKVISQQAQLTDKYKSDFKETFVGIMEGRYSSDKKLGNGWKWVWEASPNFNNNLYERLMTTIESKRAQFTESQRVLLEYKMRHDNMLQVFPSSFFLSTIAGRTPINIDIVTSDRTEKAFKTRKDNDVKLF